MSIRRLLLLFDGTWDKPHTNTNVARLHQLVATRDANGIEQTSQYFPGVGVEPGLSHLLGGAFGYGLSSNVRDGYRWLCNAWREGDELYLLGFSRGAYTARSLGGMIRKCGLLRRAAGAEIGKREVAAAYDFYRDAKHRPGDPVAVAWREKRSTDIDIRFIGVWDTVGALGIPHTASWFPFARSRYQFHDTELSRRVKYAYQALALDEHRADFAPTLWTRNPYTVQPGETLLSKKLEQIEIEQRWFIGAHADVGGGNASDGAGRRPDPLPDLPLAWLQAKAAHCGVAFTAPMVPAPDAGNGVPNDSYGAFMLGLYKHFSSPINRLLGTSINECIDASVWQRWRTDASYRSPSIVDALAHAAAQIDVADVAVPVMPDAATGPSAG